MAEEDRKIPKKPTSSNDMTPGEKKGLLATFVLGTLGIGTLIVAFYRDIMKPPAKPEQPKAGLKVRAPAELKGKAAEKEPEPVREDLKTFLERVAKRFPQSKVEPFEVEGKAKQGIKGLSFILEIRDGEDVIAGGPEFIRDEIKIQFDSKTGRITEARFIADVTAQSIRKGGFALGGGVPTIEEDNPKQDGLDMIRSLRRALPVGDFRELRTRLEGGNIYLGDEKHTRLPDPGPHRPFIPRKGEGNER